MSVAAIERCLNVVEALAAAPAGLTVTELATRLRAPKSAVHRTLATLARRGYVAQADADQTYAATLRLATLGFACLDARFLPDAADAVLRELAREVGEYCRLAVVDGDTLAWAACAQGAAPGLRYDPPMGRAIALHATASGKAWLATMPLETALALATARGLAAPPAAGPHVVRTRGALRRQLAQTRRVGFAVADEEAELGTLAYAVAFTVAGGGATRVAGTLSVAGPKARMQRLASTAVVAALRRAGDRMAGTWPLYLRQRAQTPLAGAAPPLEGTARARGPAKR